MTDYKPGQIAMVTAANRREEFRAFFDGRTWRELSSHSFCVDGPPTVRPLVVLDLDYIRFESFGLPHVLEVLRSDNRLAPIARQIEEQTRPAIDEPKGLGAVVEDSDGLRWVRTDWPQRPWDGGQLAVCWADFKAVRVLSPGVEP